MKPASVELEVTRELCTFESTSPAGPSSPGDTLVTQDPNQPVGDVNQRLRAFLASAGRAGVTALR
jgi:hypothetical protein